MSRPKGNVNARLPWSTGDGAPAIKAGEKRSPLVLIALVRRRLHNCAVQVRGDRTQEFGQALAGL